MDTPGLIALAALALAAAVLSIVAAKFKPRDGTLDKPWPLEACNSRKLRAD